MRDFNTVHLASFVITWQ